MGVLSGAEGLFTTIIGVFGSLNFVVLLAAAYTGWLHYREYLSHEQTQKRLFELQLRFVEVQMLSIEALNQLTLHIKQQEQRHEAQHEEH